MYSMVRCVLIDLVLYVLKVLYVKYENTYISGVGEIYAGQFLGHHHSYTVSTSFFIIIQRLFINTNPGGHYFFAPPPLDLFLYKTLNTAPKGDGGSNI